MTVDEASKFLEKIAGALSTGYAQDLCNSLAAGMSDNQLDPGTWGDITERLAS